MIKSIKINECTVQDSVVCVNTVCKTHSLKTWPEYFDAIICGLKTWEIRKNDRGFQVGDILHLMRYDPTVGEYTGQYVDCRVKYLLKDLFGLDPEYVIMSIEVIT